MSEQRVTIAITDGVADVRLARPEKRNALDPAMFEGLVLAGERLRDEPGVRAVVLVPVGFVSDLPTQLVAAFRATLEEVTAAALILHVRDIAHPDTDAQKADVEAVLASLGLGEGEGPPRLELWNKVDLLHGEERAGEGEGEDADRHEDLAHDREPAGGLLHRDLLDRRRAPWTDAARSEARPGRSARGTPGSRGPRCRRA